MKIVRTAAFKRMQEIVGEFRTNEALSSEGFTANKWDYTSGFFIERKKDGTGLCILEKQRDYESAFKGHNHREMEKLVNSSSFGAGDCVAVYFSRIEQSGPPVPLYITLAYNDDVEHPAIVHRLDEIEPDPRRQNRKLLNCDWRAPSWF